MSAIVRNLQVNARYDLQAPSVQIFYETISKVNGSESLSLVKDFYPNPLPADPAKQFASLQFTVDLQGLQASVTTAKITCDPILPEDPNWWLGKHPEYEPYDPSDPADADNNIASFTIDANSLQRSPNPATDSHGNPVNDLGYTTELTTGQLADWMPFKSQRISLSVNATITYRQGEVKPVVLSYQCLSTNATSGNYTSQQIAAYPEPVPVGLAEFIYDAISILQFEGQMTLQEEDVSGSVNIGNLFNLSGGALAEWSTMAAMVQSITEDIDNGTTEIQFGPPRQLNAGELVDLLRVNRLRLIRSSYSMRADGTPSDNSANVDLGQNTPEKNSIAGTAPPNPHVISNTVDGSGAVIRHESFGNDCSSQWVGFPGSIGSAPAGSVTIALSDCGGQDLKVQPLQLCLNGVSGTMYFLCSAFVPD